MIDFEKIRVAYELALKLEGPYYADFIINSYHSEYTISNGESPLDEIPFFIT